MRLVTYESKGKWRAGVIVDGNIVDSTVAATSAEISIDTDPVPNRQIIRLNTDQQSHFWRAARAIADTHLFNVDFPLKDAHLGPPIPDPDKIICLGLNYRRHAEEAGLAVPKVPLLFAKYRNTLCGPADPIILPSVSTEIDYECELAVVIRRSCKNVPAVDALDCVAGYMAFNDISARDLQFQTGQWLSGKTLDTFAPCGPVLVIDEISDPQDLNIATRINGEVLQQSNTRDMIFSVAESIAYISQLMTLEPGDIIATGTPEGVGFKRTPPIFLREGDMVEVEIENIGTLRNPVVGGKP